MNTRAKTKPMLALTQAKLIRADGTVKYYFSKPKVKWYDIKGHIWLRKRIRAMKKERKK